MFHSVEKPKWDDWTGTQVHVGLEVASTYLLNYSLNKSQKPFIR